MTQSSTRDDAWPALPLADWQDTYATLQMWTRRRHSRTGIVPSYSSPDTDYDAQRMKNER